jgi:uncharacterized protein (DUF433 family)
MAGFQLTGHFGGVGVGVFDVLRCYSDLFTGLFMARSNLHPKMKWVDVNPATSSLVTKMQANLIGRNPEIMSGALCFIPTRVPVQNLFDYLEGSSTVDEFLADFPSVTRESVIAVLETAKSRLFADAPAA